MTPRSRKRPMVIAFAVAFFVLLSLAPRPHAADDPALSNQDAPSPQTGRTMQGDQGYRKAFDKAYNDAYARKTQELDNQNSNSKGGCCG